jgi:hypothetical protein
MRTTLLAAVALAAVLGTAALAWGGPRGHDYRPHEAAMVAATESGLAGARTDERGSRLGDGRNGFARTHRHDGHDEGLGGFLGSVFFFGLFSH